MQDSQHRPQAQGLYLPEFEHDACGVGFVANMRGVRSHEIVRQGVRILKNLEHRGASGSEANTGDGAGLLMHIPHGFLSEECAKLGISLPKPGRYAVGMIFLPRDAGERAWCERTLEAAVAEAGLGFLGYRDVPTVNDHIGSVARAGEPFVRQLFMDAAGHFEDVEALERRLYLARRIAENKVWNSHLREKHLFYIPSFSTRLINYKGMLLAGQIEEYYPDLADGRFESAVALVHQRYSTNTFPSWDLAQPFRYLAHNGEINTLRGNLNWMKARQEQLESELFGADIRKLTPIVKEGVSDSASFDNVLELLVMTGRPLPHAIMMMIPEAWEHHDEMPDYRRDFYAYHASLMEPWDGPASIAFTDGVCIGAVLDRNGLRPSRYVVTDDGTVVMASEVGVLEFPPQSVVMKGRLEPGRMLLVDMAEGRIVGDNELKHRIATNRPYGEWLRERSAGLGDLPPAEEATAESQPLERLQQAFGYTAEDVDVLIRPMAAEGYEPLGSMGDDTPHAVLSDQPTRLLYDYFRQLFAQVTNPPLDAIREKLVTSLRVTLGAERNLFEESPEHCRHLILDTPMLADEDMARIKACRLPGLETATISILVEPGCGGEGLQAALGRICSEADRAIEGGASIIALSDRGVGRERMAMPMLLAAAGLHHHLIREGTRTKVGLVVETAEARETHHFAALCGYGVGGINPYLALATVNRLCESGQVEIDPATARANYLYAAGTGIVKIMSKMGISTLQSYRGAQIFEAIGLSDEVVGRYFTWTASRIKGIGLAEIAEEARMRHARGFPRRKLAGADALPAGGKYRYRRDGERHRLSPEAVAMLQDACRSGDYEKYRAYAALMNDEERNLCTLRGLLEFDDDPARAVPLEEVEPVESIVRRFKTGAMSYGSISQEAHECMAVAMNRLGGKSNSGEGGEDPARYVPLPNGDSRVSRIKQVASGRFGVTSEYLVSADEIQIKMAQGAKPGEGGELPAHKVYDWIARTRHSTPFVGLISPPPHHDIYSIEDLAQLIYDLKCANRSAEISVKLVSAVGVGTVAAGVSKGHAEVVLISGSDGGTGASRVSSIKYAGLPWELGIAETQQTLVMNDLRGRIRVEADGQLRTGRDVAMATLLGAEEFGFATVALVVMGCVMLRNCHLDTCHVGIATQNPELRKCFRGRPEHLVNYFTFVATELREVMAALGFRSIDEMVGRTDALRTRKFIDHWKAKGLDLSALLVRPERSGHVATHCVRGQDHGIERSVDVTTLMDACRPALERGEPVRLKYGIRNTWRTFGTIVGSEITRRHGAAGLPDDTIHLKLRGSAGQSFAAFTPRGMTFEIEGDANDYLGKGLSGARIVLYPPSAAGYVAEENVIAGNVALYGATSGEAFIRGRAGERFCVRNSGATAVVEGVGDHGCEYMTGGRVVVLGSTGRNFAAGMSGGIAYVLDPTGKFASRTNHEMVDLVQVDDEAEAEWLRALVLRHRELTGSEPAAKALADWDRSLAGFVKVFPREYRRALKELAARGVSVEPTRATEVRMG